MEKSVKAENRKDRPQLPNTFLKPPAVILVHPQLGENIGAVARAMLNCGLTDLRLVAPRDGWPNERALASSSGADYLIENAKLFQTTREAISDMHYVMATTARQRDMNKPIFTPEESIKKILEFSESQPVGLLYGCEKSGLSNEDITLADAIITIPLNPYFTSLNLAQAVLLTTYEWFKMADKTQQIDQTENNSCIASKAALLNLFDHLEDELEQGGFFKTEEQKPAVIQNLRAMLQRAHLSEQEIRSFHGMIVSLTGRKRRKKS